jgi:glycosyltransferase involved in cell wall biosynthesis
VQQSFPEPRSSTNPYIRMLLDELRDLPDIDVRTFSWSGALLGRYDVFHAHWPEILVTGHSPLKTVARQVLAFALLARLRLTRTPIVRTLHNLHRPSGISRVQNLFLALFERQTAGVILLNETTEAPEGTESTVIRHGHYRDWFSVYPAADAVEGRIGYFGLIRRYKGVDTLVRAFRGIPGDVTLRVAGKPSSDELRDSLVAYAGDDERIDFTFAFLSEAELVTVASSSELIVLPYREMHNSGGALAALSLDRPVLVPANEVNDLLSREVGDGWVYTYTGELTSEDLERTLASVRGAGRTDRPRLAAREWLHGAELHVQFYRRMTGRPTLADARVTPAESDRVL